MRKLLIGTTNPGKFEEYKKLLTDFGFKFEFVSPKDLNIEEPEETGKTFEENALLKAKYYYEQSKIPTLVDDGGFEIDALNGEPGIKSRRWLGRDASDEELIDEVYKRMESQENKKCRLNVFLALATPFGVMTSRADVEGVIADHPSDKRIQGYPYRSLMYFPNYGKYYCDLTEEEHEILNHRKHAIEKIKDIFKELENSK
ncbi:MAG: non-canonical purine NTP pyrophosphatase [Candidatus Doudnabacteria bacterium]|nr:non-canonical purine NTP pyrophosphatase [Candidatus Doudnabacteria bacterium]